MNRVGVAGHHLVVEALVEALRDVKNRRTAGTIGPLNLHLDSRHARMLDCLQALMLDCHCRGRRGVHPHELLQLGGGCHHRS